MGRESVSKSGRVCLLDVRLGALEKLCGCGDERKNGTQSQKIETLSPSTCSVALPVWPWLLGAATLAVKLLLFLLLISLWTMLVLTVTTHDKYWNEASCCAVWCIKVPLRLRNKQFFFEMIVLRDVVPCSLVGVYRRFRGACCLHHQGDGLDETAHYRSSHHGRRRENLKFHTVPPRLWC
jgi:hypothetical protein